MGRHPSALVAILVLLAACGRDGGVPPELPKQVKGQWGPQGSACPRLEGVFALPMSDGSAFLAGAEALPALRHGSWEAVRVERRGANDYTLVRAMGRERFLEAAAALRAAAPDAYARWRMAGLRRGFERLAEEAAAAGLAPVVAVDVPVRGCEAGWVKLARTSRSVENAQGLKHSESLEVDVTPDVQGGLLVRTTQCRLKSTQVLGTELCTTPVTRYARLVPAQWPALGVIGAADLPLPGGGTGTPDAGGKPASAGPPAAAETPPPVAVRALATAIFERLPARLAEGVTLESINARDNDVLVTLQSARPTAINPVIAALRDDADVAGVAVAEMRTTPAGATTVQLAVRPRAR